MAIVRDGTAPYTVSWDFDGNGTWDTTFNTNDAYNLSSDYTYPNQANDTLFVANIRVVDSTGATAFGSFPVQIYADVPSIANANSANADQLNILRTRAISRALWLMHLQMTNRSGNGADLTGMVDKTAGSSSGTDGDVAFNGAFIWTLALNGHYAAYPPGTYQGPETADWVSQNNTLWNNSPYAEDAMRCINHLLNTMAVETNIPDIDESDDGEAPIAGTNDGVGLYWNGNRGPVYPSPHAIGGIAVGTVHLVGTVTQIGDDNYVEGKTWPFIVQQMMDWLVFAQMDGNADVNGMGSWSYYPNRSGASQAYGSLAMWGYIGVEGAWRAMAPYGVILNEHVKKRIANNLRYTVYHSNNWLDGAVRYTNTSAPYNNGHWNLTGGGLVAAGLLGWNDTDQFNCDGSNGIDPNEQLYQPYTTVTRCEAREIYDDFYTFLDDNWTGHWTDNNYNSGCTTCGKMYSMFSTQKGARAMVPELAAYGDHDWFREFSVYLIRAQHNNGYWLSYDSYISQNYVSWDLGTAYGVFILTPTLFDPRPEALGSATPSTVIEGCAGAGAGAVTFDHSNSFHPDPDNQIVAYQWDVDASDGLWWDTGAQADFQTADLNQTFDHTYAGRGSYNATLRVVDATEPEPGNDLTSVVVTVQAAENLPPSANANGPYTVNEGDDLTLAGTGSDPNTTCGDSINAAWDLDNDGQYDDAVGLTPTVGAGVLSGLARGEALPISLRVTDSSGASTDSDTTLTIFNNRPVSCFNANPNRGACGQAITLDAGCSSHLAPDGELVSFEWDLDGDGNFDDAEGALRQLTPDAFGELNVGLRTTDGWGTVDVFYAVITVDQGNSAPAARANGPYTDFTESDFIFSAAGSSDPDGACGDSIVSYEWDLDGDGQYDDAVGPNPTVSGNALLALGLERANPRTGLPKHEIRVRVTDSLGATNEDVAILTLYGSNPIAVGIQDPEVGAILIEDFDPNIAGVAVVLLDGTRSYHENPNRGIVQWAWDVDDDGSIDANGASANIPIFFPEMPDGQVTRTIRLTVTDNAGTQATTTFQAAYKPPPTPPSTDADPDDDLPEDGYTIDLGQGVTFDGSNTTDPDLVEFNDYVKTMEWDIDGDGTYDYSFTRASGFDDLQMTLALTAQDLAGFGIDSPGDYVVTLRARDSIGLSSTDTTTLTVHGVDPVAIISADGEQAGCGAPVNFSAAESYHQHPDRVITRYEWDFDGDGVADSAQASGSFLYPAFGDYTVTLTVTDDTDRSHSATYTVIVRGGNQAPVAATNGPFTINVGEDLSYDGSGSSDPNGNCGDTITRYEWDFDGDGVAEYAGPNANGIYGFGPLSNLDAFAVANPSTGEPKMTVNLTVVDGQGVSDLISTTLTVYGTEPVANAGVDQANVGCQTPVTFSSAGTYHQDPRRSINSYQWDLDYDGNSFDVDLIGQSPSHTFTSPGVHTVALRVTDTQGNTDIDTVTVTLSVDNVAPSADAGGPYQTAIINDNPVPVRLDASGSFDANAPCDSIVSYAWDLDGDGQYDDADGPVVEGYTNPNWAPGLSQVVRVQVTDEGGLTADAQVLIQVQTEPPPSVEALGPEAGLRICGQTQATFNVSDPEGDIVTVIATMSGQEIGRVDVDTPDDGSSVGGSINFNPGDFDDGDYLVTFTARDAGGGEASDVTDGTFAITCDSDADGDLVPDVEDNCPNDANLDQSDTDGDGLGDACDACIFDANNDVDGDGVCGDVDNCPRHANPGQVDDNGDGHGDACVDPSADFGLRGEVGEGVAVGANADLGNDGRIGDNVEIGDNADFGNAVDLGNNAQIGDDVAVGRDFDLGENAQVGNGVNAGDFVNVGNDVQIGDGVQIGQDADIGDRAVIEGGDNPAELRFGAQVGNDARVGAGAVVGNGSSVGANADVGENVEIQPNSSVGDNSVVGDNTQIRANSEVGNDANFGSGVTVADYVEIGDNVALGDNTSIRYGARFGNDISVGANSNIGGVVEDGVTIGTNANVRGRTTIGTGTTIGNNLSMRSLDVIGANGTIGDGLTTGSRVTVGDNANFGNNVTLNYRATVGNNVTLGDEAQIDNGTLVGDGSNIGARTRVYSRSTIGANVTIGQDCIILGRTTIGDGTVIEDYTIIYYSADIGANVVIRNSGAPDTPRNIGNRHGQVTIGDGVEIDEDVADYSNIQ
ncbi:MAG: PKD domain-containing protein [Bradymonadia bacterium]